MPSRSPGTTVEARSEGGVLYRLLDLIFGHIAWAVHFLVVYIGAAVACVLGLGAAASDMRAGFTAALAIVTILAAAVVVLHAVTRYRENRRAESERFTVWVTIGNDAIATVGILWQLYPILLVPVCE